MILNKNEEKYMGNEITYYKKRREIEKKGN